MTTLKISDLSVGDWMRYDNGVTPYSIHSIVRTGDQECVVLKDDMYPDGITGFVKYLKPIPITAEILEANGFVEKESCLFRYEREWRGDKSSVNICSFDEELWFADFEFRDGRTCMSNIPLFYINQLQHVLRLMGVDKEINL